MIQRKARIGAGSVWIRLTPYRSRCTAPGMAPRANSSAGRKSMTSGPVGPIRSCSDAGVTATAVGVAVGRHAA